MAKLVSVDLDDVVLDLWTRVVQCFEDEYDTTLPTAGRDSWQHHPLKTSPKFGADQRYATWWDWWRDRASLWAHCKAVPGALGGLSELKQAGWTIELVTHTPYWARKYKNQWLAKWNPDYDRITFVPLDEPKHEHSSAEILVDDKWRNVHEWTQRRRGTTALLFRQPWNRCYARHSQHAGGLILPAEGWDDVVKELT